MHGYVHARAQADSFWPEYVIATFSQSDNAHQDALKWHDSNIKHVVTDNTVNMKRL